MVASIIFMPDDFEESFSSPMMVEYVYRRDVM